tara:strand:- start:1390 stop:2100 length:711 start_codon:yes stop_codon:yes gene_type:complete
MHINSKVTTYEKFKNHNFITRYLHDNKYKFIDRCMEDNFGKKNFRVLDIGSGLSEFYRKFNNKYNFDYCGIEPNKKFYSICNENLSANKNYRIVCEDIEVKLDSLEEADLILCLDVLEHLNIGLRDKLINKISKMNFKKLFITVPNEFGPAILIKNFGSRLINYKRDFEYSFVETLKSSMYMFDKLPPHTIYHKNFYWKHLYYTLYTYFDVSIKTSLDNFLPKNFSPSISFICTKR